MNVENNNEVHLPNGLASLQVPLIQYFPSGHTQVAPEGFSKQRNSHAKSKQGFGTEENKQRKIKRCARRDKLQGYDVQ